MMKTKWMKKLLVIAMTGMLITGIEVTTLQPVYAANGEEDPDEDDKGKNKKSDDDRDKVDDSMQYLRLIDTYQTPTVQYGQNAIIGLPVANYSTVPLRDVVVTAKVSNLVSEWPFEPNAAGTTQTIRNFPAYDRDKNISDMRQDIGFVFKVREDVKTGYYPITFDVTYNREGITEKCELTTYVHTIGKEESGYLDEKNDNIAKPRIIVTGFETNPGTIYAGDTFTLTVHMKNTSSETKVSNILFDMKSVEQGKDADTTFAAFLPTSGASSIYVENMAPGQSQDLNIELSAKSDLAQKPYVLDIDMKYDAGENYDLSDKASVSIPIYQEQRCETGDAEVSPSDILVGEQSNIMFDVYNTGKTTLYNVWVKFKGDSISGGDTFLGTITSGATGSVDAMVQGVAGTMDDGVIKAIISYENESGVVTSIEKDITLMVGETFEENYDDYDMGEEGIMDEQPSNAGVRIAVIAGVCVLVLIVLIIVLKKRKAKKMQQKSLEAELEALDENQ